MNRQIILCADDFAQNPTISEGILRLGEKKRINAISCMVNLPDWQDAGKELVRVKKDCYIGLHLNLTWGDAVSSLWRQHHGTSFGKLGALMRACWLGQLNPGAIDAEIEAQVAAFAKVFGAAPDFIDGHQHVHQFPGIRESLSAWYGRQTSSLFVRNTSSGLASDCLSPWGFPKRAIISLAGGRALQKLLRQQAIPANDSFAGVYPFARAREYRSYFCYFLSVMRSNGLIMCHPGLAGNDQDDPLRHSRVHEFNYFMSDSYLEDMAEHACQLNEKPQS